MRKLLFTVAALTGILLTASTNLRAAPITITFTELPTQPVDNLSLLGVTFDFKIGGVDSLDANFNSFGPGSIVNVQDPSLEGNSNGKLQLDFAQPTNILSFGVALSQFGTFTPGFNVEIFDPALNPIGVIGITTNSLVSFTEGQFTYSGSPISRATIDFTIDNTRFALDNLTFDSAAVVPEPASLIVWSVLAIGGGVAWRRRKAVNAA